MKIIGLYDFAFFIPKRNPNYVIEDKVKGQRGKAITSTNEYTNWPEGGASRRKQLKNVLASTIELLAYSPTAYKLIFEEDWGATLLEQCLLENNCIDIINNKTPKETHQWEVSSKPLMFLLIIFVSYNSLYTRKLGDTTYRYTSILSDLNKVLTRSTEGISIKTDIIEQNGNQLMGDLYLNHLLNSTINKLDLCKNSEFIEAMLHMKDALEFFHKEFLSFNEIFKSPELKLYLITLEKHSWGDKPQIRFKRYIELNEVMHELNENDIQIMKNVVKELFEFKSSDEYESKVKENNQWANSSQLEDFLEYKKRGDMNPLKDMLAKLSKKDKSMVKKINEEFPL